MPSSVAHPGVFDDLLSNAEKKNGDTKWRKVIRPSFLAFTALFVMFMLFLCNVAVNDPYNVKNGVWSASMFRSNPQNCTDSGISETSESEKGGPRLEETRSDSDESTNLLLQSRRPEGTESLPRGIVEATSDLELRHLWKVPEKNVKDPQNLLAMAVGIKQKSNVNRIIQKFPADNFTVMLFHYDGKVDDWNDLTWSGQAIHIMAFNQTKWWFAKRFLHPDVVAKYNYLFLWDEDLGVEYFHAERYLDIMEDEGLEISQPALHRNSSEVHHRLTILNRNSRAHRRIYSSAGRHQCDASSTGPPCTGWVEMMAPVFSRAAWRCSWYMIQNDLVHAWGMDYKLGYCAQGIRSEKVGIIDREFIVHEGIPSLGGPRLKKAVEDDDTLPGIAHPPAVRMEVDTRSEIRKRAGVELDIFSRRWRRAAANDEHWHDPYKQPLLDNIEAASEKSAVNKQVGPLTVKLVKGSKYTKGKGNGFKTRIS